MSRRLLMKVRSALTALALVVAPGVAVLGTATDAFAVTKISEATATQMFREVGITWPSSGNCSDRYRNAFAVDRPSGRW
ncbi:hypothetical protein [Streptomyces sp. NPDC007856]|uniref:hypothetical protein n=1 Tax=Streptomyces sp. NPDC007856 TaxID=3364781 RepID=UPI0036B747CD